mmetsp:Transcript_61989/g.85515  ORF Transcript_61989/g.85515 Transcript_61989/m.85515 type:complete len:323 (-) Transcript_61989:3-971(-)
MDGLHALLAQGHRQREELAAVDHVRLDEGALRHALLAREAGHDAVCELGTGEGHGERGGAAAGLRLHDLVAAEHDAVREGVALLVGEADGRLGLRQEGHDGRARVAANHRHLDLRGVVALGATHEGLCAAHIQGGNAEELLGVVHALRLQHLGSDRHRGVDGVRDDQDGRIGAGLGAARDQVLHDAGVDVEQVVARHAGLARHAGRDHHNIAAVQSLGQLITREARARRVGGDVGEVRGNAGGDGSHVEARERSDPRVDLQQQREWLADAARGAQDAALEAALLLGQGGLAHGTGGAAEGGEHGGDSGLNNRAALGGLIRTA